MQKKIAIIDLGSNSVRLVIFEIKSNGAFRLVDDISDTVRLSESMVDGKNLNDFAMRKALKTVKLFKKLCAAYHIPARDIMAVATEAVRKADNKDQFLSMVSHATGIQFRLLSGDEEALYVYRAVAQTIDVPSGIIVDIGGGSTEIIRFANRSVIAHISLPIGSVVATEEFLDKDVIIPEKLARLEQHMHSVLSALDWLSAKPGETVIGLGGTIRNLSKIHRRQVNYPVDMTHNYQISVSDFCDLYEQLKNMDLEARKKVRGMSAKRADIIVGGLTVLKCICSAAGTSQLVVSGSGLREGVLFEAISQGRWNRKPVDVLDDSLNNFMDLYDIRREHADHICALSLSLYDQLSPLHKMGAEERKLLKVAALLHDIGISVSYYGHPDHSFYMIMNARLNGLSHREIILSAAIAASHGKDRPRKDILHPYQSVLRKTDMRTIEQLSLLLRIAECLDRSETGIVADVACQLGKNSVKLKTLCSGDAELELSLAGENGEEFRRLFKRLLVVQ